MATTALPQIGVVATRALAELVRSTVGGFGQRFELRLIEKPAAEAIAVAQALIQAGMLDVVIAAGRGAELLRPALSVPVIQIRVTGVDILRALMAARQMNPRTVLLTRRRLADDVEKLKPILNFELTPLIYETDQEARRHLDTLTQAVKPVVVGSSEVVYLASLYDLPSVLIYSAESVAAAFDSALALNHVAQVEAAKRERLDRILESLTEGVAAVDLDDCIQTINPALANLLGVAAEWAVGRRWRDIAPSLSLTEVIRQGEAVRDEVVTVAGRRLVTQRLPLIEAGQQVGAVLTLHESAAIERADRKLRADARKQPFRARYSLADVIGDSPAIQAARDLAQLYAGSDSSVLIGGESGTGKELFAQGIHQASSRAANAFVAINCAAFPENLLESELFGYEEGAFTGSRRGGKPGFIELADRGTLFLDEIGDMPLPLQTRLLRVLQEREVLRLGAAEPIPVDVRVIAATNTDLAKAVASGGFRTDLYYRLNILGLQLPSLAARGGDVSLLATWLALESLAKLNAADIATAALVQPLLDAAQHYRWPGNVRELQNMVERLAVFVRAHGQLTVADIKRLAPELSVASVTASPTLASTADAARQSHAQTVLAECGGDRQLAADKLGISRTTLWRLLKS